MGGIYTSASQNEWELSREITENTFYVPNILYLGSSNESYIYPIAYVNFQF